MQVDGVDLDQLPDALYNASFVCLAHDRFQDGVVSISLPKRNQVVILIVSFPSPNIHRLTPNSSMQTKPDWSCGRPLGIS